MKRTADCAVNPRFIFVQVSSFEQISMIRNDYHDELEKNVYHRWSVKKCRVYSHVTDNNLCSLPNIISLLDPVLKMLLFSNDIKMDSISNNTFNGEHIQKSA